jgi:hypothetical protein
MKCSRITIFILASYVVSTSVMAANNQLKDAVTVTVYNVETQNPQTDFNVGDTVGYTVTAILPPSADSQQANIDVELAVKIRGITLPYKLSQKINAPVTGIDKTTGTGTSIPGAFTPVNEAGQFVVPAEASGSSVSIKVKVDIKGVGAVTKEQSITIN